MKRSFFQEAQHSASDSILRFAIVLTAGMAGAVLIGAASSRALAGDAKRLEVLELFTSQGCSSCPPADKLLAELAKRENILALSFPVSYWDHLGWKDTLAKDSYNERQRDYAEARGDREIYTPQIVINGVTHEVGSQRSSIESAITTTSSSLRSVSVPVSLSENGNAIRVEAGAAPAGSTVRSGKILLAFYSRAVAVNIGRGENHDRKVTYTNVVRELKNVGDWNGEPAHYTVEIPHGTSFDSCAALLQANTSYAMVGAAEMPIRAK